MPKNLQYSLRRELRNLQSWYAVRGKGRFIPYKCDSSARPLSGTCEYFDHLIYLIARQINKVQKYLMFCLFEKTGITKRYFSNQVEPPNSLESNFHYYEAQARERGEDRTAPSTHGQRKYLWQSIVYRYKWRCAWETPRDSCQESLCFPKEVSDYTVAGSTNRKT